MRIDKLYSPWIVESIYLKQVGSNNEGKRHAMQGNKTMKCALAARQAKQEEASNSELNVNRSSVSAGVALRNEPIGRLTRARTGEVQPAAGTVNGMSIQEFTDNLFE